MYLERKNIFRRKNIGIVGQKSFGVYLPAASTGLPELRAAGASNAGTIPASIADFQRAAVNSHYATSEVARSGGGGNRGSLVSSKQQQQPLWIDRRWNGADFEKGCEICDVDTLTAF